VTFCPRTYHSGTGEYIPLLMSVVNYLLRYIFPSRLLDMAWLKAFSFAWCVYKLKFSILLNESSTEVLKKRTISMEFMILINECHSRILDECL